jgi:hypothetical protein
MFRPLLRKASITYHLREHRATVTYIIEGTTKTHTLEGAKIDMKLNRRETETSQDIYLYISIQFNRHNLSLVHQFP